MSKSHANQNVLVEICLLHWDFYLETVFEVEANF
jgi:hypothetical protein